VPPVYIPGVSVTRKKEINSILFFSQAMVFNNLEGNNIEYTLRLRHEVTDTNTWDTGSLAADPQLPEPRIRK